MHSAQRGGAQTGPFVLPCSCIFSRPLAVFVSSKMMKNVLNIFVILLLIAIISPALCWPRIFALESDQFIEQYIVKLKDKQELKETFVPVQRLESVYIVHDASFTHNSSKRSSMGSYLDWVEPNVPNTYKKRTNLLVSDPNFADQWHLSAINLDPARQTGIYGTGVKLRINDDGVFSGSTDLAVDFNSSFNFVTKAQDPSPPSVPECFTEGEAFCAHGTFCASIAAGLLGNGVCGVGVAPAVRLSGAAVIGYRSRTTISDVAEALVADVDIASNSWGLSGCEYRENPFVRGGRAFPYCILAPIPRVILEAVERATQENRQGLGTIFVLAGGNTGDLGDDTNYQDFARLRQVITVGSTTRSGRVASYSAPGAGVSIVAPGGSEDGDEDPTQAIFSYTKGYFSEGSAPTERCAAMGSGTSWSAPIVAGAVALLLEVNPTLSWRDVQHVLYRSARRADPENPTWQQNGAGFFFSEFYGFGLLDVGRALDAARAWQNVEAEASVRVTARGETQPIADDSSMTRSFLLINESMALNVAFVEHVEVNIDIVNEEFGQAAPGVYLITLTSPSGSVAALSRPRPHLPAPNQPAFRDYKLLSRAHWGEPLVGSWILEIKYDPSAVIALCITAARQKEEDPSRCQPDPANNPSGSLLEWNITIFGPQNLAQAQILSTEGTDPASAETGRNSQTGRRDSAGISAHYGNMIAVVSASDESVVAVEPIASPPLFSAADLATEVSAPLPTSSTAIKTPNMPVFVAPCMCLIAIFSCLARNIL